MSSYKKDGNHNAVMKIFQQFGFTCLDSSWSRGKMLDFLAYKRYGEIWFVEVKNGNKPLTQKEKEFIAHHGCRSIVIRSEQEAEIFCAEVSRL